MVCSVIVFRLLASGLSSKQMPVDVIRMPGVRGYTWRQGDRSEYLAQYFLSAIGVAAPVIRQEDIGIDFSCALAREDDQKVTFHSPFSVQVGSIGSKAFIYGGLAANGKWRKASLDWLFSQELPLFVCTIDRVGARCRLYHTGAMWLARYNFGDMTEVQLCPEEWHDPVNGSRSAEPIDKNGNGDGYSYRIPLGNPIADLTVADLETAKRQSAIDAMEEAVKAEQRNITNRRLGVHIVTTFPGAPSNDASWLRRHKGGGTFWSTEPGRNVSQQLEELKNLVTVLALNLHAQGDVKKIDHLAPVFNLFGPGMIPPWLEEKLPDAFFGARLTHRRFFEPG